MALGYMRWATWVVLLGGFIISIAPSQAADVENRDFAITIDNKPAGAYHMQIATAQDGTTTVRAQADVNYRVFIVRYTYTFRGMEVWKGGRLISLRSSSNDDGKRFTVQARADGNNLQVTINGADNTLRGDVWTTSAWQRPADRFLNHTLPMVDADTGRALSGRLEYVDQREIAVGGSSVVCSHFRVSGGTQMELYFDSHNRLVRQETVEQGHATAIQLTGVRR